MTKFLKQKMAIISILVWTCACGQKKLDLKLNGNYKKIIEKKSVKTYQEKYLELSRKILNKDTTLTQDELIFTYVFSTTKQDFNATIIDTLASRIYQLNENEQYAQAILNADTLLQIAPLNVMANKEKIFALKKLNKINDLKFSDAILRKLSKAILMTGNGLFEKPIFITNYFEGLALEELFFACSPSKEGVFLDKKNRVLAAYYCFSSKYNEIFIRYFNLTHSENFYKNRINMEEL
jgi:hypothetical protein